MAERKDRQERHERDRVSRLDQPRDRHRTLRSTLKGRSYDSDRFGRFAESFARFMGTATFLVWMTIFIVAWVIWNASWGPDRHRWDEYPFIFLTLILSLQASYAAPLILLAQNRQEARDRVQQEHDRDANAQSHADMEFLTREVASLRLGINEVATRDFIRSELRGLAESLSEDDQDESTDRRNDDRKDDDRRSGQSH